MRESSSEIICASLYITPNLLDMLCKLHEEEKVTILKVVFQLLHFSLMTNKDKISISWFWEMDVFNHYSCRNKYQTKNVIDQTRESREMSWFIIRWSNISALWGNDSPMKWTNKACNFHMSKMDISRNPHSILDQLCYIFLLLHLLHFSQKYIIKLH